MVLGIPILDVAIVIINRLRRGQSPLHYDKTHLHHRFMATGLSVRQICYVLYGLMILFGILALSMPRIYKLVGMSLVGLTMAGLIIWLDYRQRQRGTPIRLDGSEPTPLPEGGAEEPAQQEPPAPPTDTDEGNGVAQATATPPPPGSTAGHLHVQLPL
jgi:UDP-GlcNAc:undecaprenyl-phosphate GlcNAc-1-phosphate transferase